MVLMLTFIANGLKILFIRFSSYISAQIGTYIGVEIYNNYLTKPIQITQIPLLQNINLTYRKFK